MKNRQRKKNIKKTIIKLRVEINNLSKNIRTTGKFYMLSQVLNYKISKLIILENYAKRWNI